MMGGGNYPIKPSYSSHSAHSNDNGYGADEYNSNTMYSSDNKPYYYYDEYQKRSPPIYNSPSKHRQPSPERSRCEARPNYNSQQYNEQDDYPDSYKRNGRHDDRIMKKRRDPLPSPEEGYRPGHRPQKHNLVSNLPRPSIVKRETSHQNENLETKRNVKRSMFRQDYGISINEPRTTVSGNSDEDDKKPYTVADVFDDNFGRNNVEDDMKVLETTMGQSTLNTPRIAKRNSKNSGSKLKNNCYGEKPKGLTSSERMSTVDAVRLEFTTGISVDEVEKLSSIVNVDRGCSVDRIVEEMEVSSKFIEIRTEGSSKFKLMDGFDFDEEHIPQKPVPISKDRFSSDDAVEFTIREVDSLKETSKFSIGSRESTFGSIELDIDSENPDKIWGEE
uniref:Uncharacterized protein n=1 Tax=Eucampia antarctica TaxID=49252 RepID=A0A7S2R9Q7_9STRA|mmetsp:Transcript_19126/g.18368  ORF Transcript_19126/g.18368 Transcript_19126/m.18368 type:complete len:389 (+) Transcript_19126:1-1167(+)